MGRKNKLNYAVDGVIGLAFALTALTGLVFLLPDAAGTAGRTFLYLSRVTWRDLHTWFSLVLVAGILVHLALHGRWIAHMTFRRAGRCPASARLNYALDVVIAVAGIAVLLTGLVFLFGGQGGFQGGRNPAFQTEMLGLARQGWRDLHAWTGLVMIAGLLVHLALHWEWIVCTTGQLLSGGKRQVLRRAEVQCEKVCESEV